jgi:hypothetical protein
MARPPTMPTTVAMRRYHRYQLVSAQLTTCPVSTERKIASQVPSHPHLAASAAGQPTAPPPTSRPTQPRADDSSNQLTWFQDTVTLTAGDAPVTPDWVWSSHSKL